MNPSSRRFLLGCHLSIAKGFVRAIDEAENLGNTALQIFSRSARTWRTKPIDSQDAQAFQARLADSSVQYVVIHATYLANLASPDPELYERSIEAMIVEVQRAALLGIGRLVFHPGSHVGSGPDAGVRRVVDALNRVISSSSFQQAENLMLLVENTAGSGSSIGSSFAELGQILDGVRDSRRFGVCLDTCHAHAAGIDLRTPVCVEAALDAADRVFGSRRLDLIHLNDAASALGSRRDRHAHIGLGEIGDEGFAAILQSPRLRDLPFVLETPKEIDGQSGADRLNLTRVRKLRDQGAQS